MNLLEPNPFWLNRLIYKHIIKWENKQYEKFKRSIIMRQTPEQETAFHLFNNMERTEIQELIDNKEWVHPFYSYEKEGSLSLRRGNSFSRKISKNVNIVWEKVNKKMTKEVQRILEIYMGEPIKKDSVPQPPNDRVIKEGGYIIPPNQ